MEQRRRNAVYVVGLFLVLALFAAGFVFFKGMIGTRARGHQVATAPLEGGEGASGAAHGSQGLGAGADQGEVTPGRARDRRTVLVLGTDNVEGSRRSDTMVLAMVGSEGSSLSLLSIPRDTLAEIPGHGRQKITHAYAFGGPALSVAAVEGLLGLAVDYYVVLNFESFERLVDALGGVYVNVPRRMKYTDRAGGLRIDLEPGLQRLDGKKALGFVRFRDSEGDIGRVGRQVEFIKAVARELVSPDVVTRLPCVLWSLAGLIDTNIPPTEVARMVRLASRVDPGQIEAFMLPGEPIMIDGKSCWVTDPAAVARVVREFDASAAGGTIDSPAGPVPYSPTASTETSLGGNG